LEKNINDPKICLIEVSVTPGVYEIGHIQGVINYFLIKEGNK